MRSSRLSVDLSRSPIFVVIVLFFKAISASEFEVSAAATIDPNAVLVTSPGTPFNTRRVAALAHQANRSAIADRAIMALSVTRFAVEVLNHSATISIIIAVAVAVAVTATIAVAVAVAVVIAVSPVIAVSVTFSGYEFGAATSIHPDATT